MRNITLEERYNHLYSPMSAQSITEIARTLTICMQCHCWWRVKIVYFFSILIFKMLLTYLDSAWKTTHLSTNKSSIFQFFLRQPWHIYENFNFAQEIMKPAIATEEEKQAHPFPTITFFKEMAWSTHFRSILLLR